jgi:hypothetical protein
MATLPTTSVSKGFKGEVTQLCKAWEPIAKGYAQLAKKHLDFAKSIVELWQTAKDLDRGTKKTDHADYMRQQIQGFLQTNDESILSRWRTIGLYADTLLPVAKHLPSDRDHLYQLATAVKQEKPVKDWIEAKKIHPGVSVRDIKTLNTEGIRKKSKSKATRTQSVTFNFSSDVEAKEIVELLRSAFSSDRVATIIADARVVAECEDTLRDIFDELEQKFVRATAPKVKKAASKRRKISKK